MLPTTNVTMTPILEKATEYTWSSACDFISLLLPCSLLGFARDFINLLFPCPLLNFAYMILSTTSIIFALIYAVTRKTPVECAFMVYSFAVGPNVNDIAPLPYACTSLHKVISILRNTNNWEDFELAVRLQQAIDYFTRYHRPYFLRNHVMVTFYHEWINVNPEDVVTFGQVRRLARNKPDALFKKTKEYLSDLIHKNGNEARNLQEIVGFYEEAASEQ